MPSVIVNVVVVFALFVIILIALIWNRIRALELVEIHGETPPPHVADIEALGFDRLGDYTVAGQRVTTFLGPGGESWAIANWSTKSLVLALASIGQGKKLETVAISRETRDANVFVQYGAASPAEAIEWHRSLINAAREIAFAPDRLTHDQARLEIQKSHDEFDGSIIHAARIALRLITRRHVGVKGPVDSTAAELRSFFSSS
ncbi:MAG: hypothetical protein ACR2P0_19510 [Acidimicrobiales bacterium]